MNQIVNLQARLFITCIEIGIVMGILFDSVRIFRKMFKHNDFFVQLEDLLYWVVCGFVGFYMLYVTNFANIRIFIIIGIGLGAVLYFCSFSIVFMKVATKFIIFTKKILRQIICLIGIPIKKIIYLMKWPLNYLGKKYERFKWNKKQQLRVIKRERYQKKADALTQIYLKKQRK